MCSYIIQRNDFAQACLSVHTGSGSTIVCYGSDVAPDFLSEQQYSNILVRPARFLARQSHRWYEAPPNTANAALCQ